VRIHLDDPEDWVECLICGDRMRRLAGHLKTHGVTSKDYLARFPGAPLTCVSLCAIAGDQILDRRIDGEQFFGRTPGVCLKGHALVGDNVYVRADGSRQCDRCRREKFRAYYEANKERELARLKAHREANRDRVRAKAKAYYEAHREERIEANRRYRKRKQAEQGRRQA
jgi:hypothetical protein